MSTPNTLQRPSADDFDETWSEYSLWSHNATLENTQSLGEPDFDACPEEAIQTAANQPELQQGQSVPRLRDSTTAAELNQSLQYSFLHESFVSRGGNESLADEVETQVHRIQLLEQKLRSAKSTADRVATQQLTLLRWFASVPALRPLLRELQMWVRNPQGEEPDFMRVSSPKSKAAGLDASCYSVPEADFEDEDFVDVWKSILSKDIEQHKLLAERRLLKTSLAQYSGKLSALESTKIQLFKRIEGLENNLESEKYKNQELLSEIEELKSNILNHTFSEAVHENDIEELKNIIKKQEVQIGHLEDTLHRFNTKENITEQPEYQSIPGLLEVIASRMHHHEQNQGIKLEKEQVSSNPSSTPNMDAFGHQFDDFMFKNDGEQAPSEGFKCTDGFDANSLHSHSDKGVSRVEELEVENARLKKEVQDLETQLFNLVSEKLKWQMSRIDDTDIPLGIEEMIRSQFAENTVELSNLRTENKRIERNYQRVLKELSDKEKLIVTLQQVWDQSQNPLDNIRGLQVKVSNANRNHSEACKVIESLKAEMSIMSQQIDMLRAELRRYQSEAADKAAAQATKSQETSTAATISTPSRLNLFRSYSQPK